MEKERLGKSYRIYLRDELLERKGKNPHYSLRAFARDLGISATVLSEVLSHKRHLSQKNFLRIADKLVLSPEEKLWILNEIKGNPELTEDEEEILQLKEDTFRMMSDWYYFGILSLSRIKESSANPVWIAKRLGISPFEAKTAVETLRRLGFVKTEKGKLRRTSSRLETTLDVPSSALRKFHKQHLALGQLSIERDSVDTREFNTMTMAVDPKKIKEAQRLMLAFRERLSRFMEKGKASEVYVLAMQLFPLSRQGGKA